METARGGCGFTSATPNETAAEASSVCACLTVDRGTVAVEVEAKAAEVEGTLSEKDGSPVEKQMVGKSCQGPSARARRLLLPREDPI